MKTIVVTGVSRGVGLEICAELLKCGCKVIGLSRNKASEFEILQEEYRGKLIFEPFDLGKTKDIPDLYKSKLKQYGPLDGLVNNAAIAYDDLITNCDVDKLESMYAVNVFSPIVLTKYVLRDLLLHSRVGAFVYITSISSKTGYKGLAMYGSTKGALEAFIKGSAREWGPKGHRFNCVSPGFMETDMSSSLSLEQKTRIYKRTSMKKATSISSVAQTVNFLISEKSSSITGEVINVDCGTI